MERVYLTDNTECPYCGSDNTDIQEDEFAQPYYRITWGCLQCDRLWTNVYTYSGTQDD